MKNNKKFCFITILLLVATLLVGATFTPINVNAENDNGSNQSYGTTNNVKTSKLDLLPYVFALNDGLTEGRWIVSFGLAIDNNGDGDINKDEESYTKKYLNDNNIKLFESARISVRTRDGSAIASLGDYEPVSTTVSLIDQINSTISIDVANYDWGIEGYNRQFYFEITEVEVLGLDSGFMIIDPTQTPKSSVKTFSLSVDFDFKTKSVSDDKGYSLMVLSDLGTYTAVTNYEHSLEGYFSWRWTYADVAAAPNDWFTKLKYLAEKGALELGFQYDATGYESSGAWLYIDDALINVGFGVIIEEKWESRIKRLASWSIQFRSDKEEYLGIANQFTGTFEGINAGVWIDGAASYQGHIDSMKDFVKIHDISGGLEGSTNFYISLSCEGVNTAKNVYAGSKMNFFPINSTAKVVDNTLGKLRFNEDGDPIIGMSMRFSEPVQIQKRAGMPVAKPTILAYANGSSNTKLNFEYVSGEGTDTLYFEANAKHLTNSVSKIVIQETQNFNCVFDVGADVSGQGPICVDRGAPYGLWGAENIKTNLQCSFDFRTPNIAPYKNPPTSVAKNHIATIRPENVSSKGVIYYGWTEEDPEVNPLPPTNLTATAVSETGAQNINSPSNISGKRWLYVTAVSELGKVCKEALWMGPYYFDNDQPTLSATCTDNGYKQKSFSLVVDNNVANIDKKADLKSVYAVVSTDDEGNNVVANFPVNLKDKDPSSDDFTFNLTITANQLKVGMDGNLEYGTYYISFVAVDTLENAYQTERYSYYYDVRDVFDVAFETTTPINVTLDKGLGTNYHATTLTQGTKVTFTSDNLDVNIAIKEIVRLSDNKVMTAGIDYQEGILANTEEVTFLDGFMPGSYRIIFKDTSSGSTKESLVQYLYVTAGTDIGNPEGTNKGEDTILYTKSQNGSLITNLVYQLPKGSLFSYADELGAITTEYYGGTNLAASFSSDTEAYNYVYYHELLDLYAITLTEQMASDLNQGIYRKADGVKEEAVKGQVWVRYKNANWRPSTTTATWVYYYYADVATDPLTISEGALSSTLKNALHNVSTNIVMDGSYVDLVLNENLDIYGAPKLDEKQMHIGVEFATETKCKTQFSTPVEYIGDASLYAPQDFDSPLSSTVVINMTEHTQLYYKTSKDANYIKISDVKGLTFAEYFRVSGKYQILEFDVYGVREYSIYVDVDAPGLKVSWHTTTGNTIYKIFTQNNNNQTISGTNFYIEGFEDGEYDNFAFISLYEYHAQGVGTLLVTYRASDFAEGMGLDIPDGTYYIHVSDRSGNDYLFVFQVKSEPLVCKIKEIENTSIELSINRAEKEIVYRVYLDGFLLTTNYNEKKFNKAGYYQFYIEDIYGNVYDEYYYAYEYEVDAQGNYIYDENGAKIPKLDAQGNKIHVLDADGMFAPAYYNFVRDLPVVDWRYKNAEGNFIDYVDGSTIEMNVIKTSDRNYSIATSTSLRFLLPNGCNYEVLSGYPAETKVGLTQWIEIKNLTPFSIKVYYESHKDTYVIYKCTVDASAPTVSVYYQENSYSLVEYEEIQSKLDNGEFVLGNNAFEPTFIGFKTITERTVYVENGGVAYSPFYRLNVSDTNGVKEMNIYLNGELIITRTADFNKVILSRYGTYQIKVVDNFGNQGSFTFTNNKYSFVEYSLDGNALEVVDDCIQYFDYDNKFYSKQDYGNTKTEIKLLSSAKIYYLITDEFDNQYYFAFLVEDGAVYPLTYIVNHTDEEDEVLIERGVYLINLLAQDATVGTDYQIVKSEECGVSIYARIDASNNVILSVKSSDDAKKTFTVETRVVVDGEYSPYYFKAEISNVQPSVGFVDKYDAQYDFTATNVKINDSFKVKVEEAGITSVKVAFAASGQYGDYIVVYDGTYHEHLFSEEGMYHVEVINKYGVKTDYYVVLTTRFLVTTTVNYADGTTVDYSSDYTFDDNNGTFYSNKSVKFIVYSSLITLKIGDETTTLEQNAQGFIEVLVDKVGVSNIYIVDEYGNEFTKKVEISIRTISADGFLYGFNENALKRDENYTNQMISISKDKVDEFDIAYISVYYGGVEEIIFDQVSENKIELFPYMLLDCIGDKGDGEYKVILRDIYGNKVEEIVHYRETSTLTVERVTVNALTPEIYPLETLLSVGVWTNNKITFVIAATEYELTVDGLQNVLTISYDSKTKDEYSVYYLDEYGFKYEFKVYLHRQDVVINATSDVNVVEIGDELVTKDELSVTFTENATCTYVYNQEQEVLYTAGEKLYRDGTYIFKVVDLAGNTSVYTIKKDSVVEYSFEGSGANEKLINGMVTNGSQVNFYSPNSDALITKVFHNNELIEYSETKFTERGKWEVLISDAIGNTAYFRFYIIRGKIDGFTYNTPYDYLITSVMWENGGTIAEATETIKNLGKTLEATQNGNYKVVMTSSITGEQKTFNFTIDKTPPKISLDGCDQNEKTVNDVTVKGYTIGDTIYVYKDGKLYSTNYVDSNSFDAPVIKDGGKYKIVVENEAGVTSELSFERKYIPNVAGSVLIIFIMGAIVTGLLIGLIWRNHSKTDE